MKVWWNRSKISEALQLEPFFVVFLARVSSRPIITFI